MPLHLGVTIGLLGGGSIALLALLPPGPIPLTAWIAAVFVVVMANFVEYALHRWPMHRRRRLTQSFFKKHTIAHHRYFTHETMEIEGVKDVPFILSSVPVLVASLAFVLLIVGGLTVLLGSHVALFSGAALGLYGLLSQFLHVAFHLPEKWLEYPILRSRLFRRMRDHHVIHHNLKMMTKWNFNIGIPLFDALFGTLTWEK